MGRMMENNKEMFLIFLETKPTQAESSVLSFELKKIDI